MSAVVWICKGCGHRVVQQPHLIPEAHYVKSVTSFGGYWCDAGYEREHDEEDSP